MDPEAREDFAAYVNWKPRPTRTIAASHKRSWPFGGLDAELRKGAQQAAPLQGGGDGAREAASGQDVL